MDLATLKQMLDERLSLAEIGRRVGLDELTVAYWARKHVEASKCVLLCANCHAEVEAGMLDMEGRD